MITAQNIQKSYGDLDVLKGVDLEIKEGEIVSIVGASGAGKTTLLQILGTLDRADNGNLQINGEEIGSLQKREVTPAHWSLRFLNRLLDHYIIYPALFYVAFMFLIHPAFEEILADEEKYDAYGHYYYIVNAITIILLHFSVYFIEFISGRSIAKFITRTKVYSKEGYRPTRMQFITRWLCRLIPFLEISMIWKKHPVGWHDAISDTIVAKDRKDLEYVHLRDVVLDGNELAKFRNEQIGFIFQFHHLLPEFTALENVCIAGYIGGRPKSEVEASGKEILKFLGLSNRLDHKPSEMSGGEQQRVAVARALINNPKVVFADEPSGNLDSKTAQELHQLFFDLREKFNQTFVIVTHNEDLAEMADRKLVMRDGMIV
jgi:ABC-type lipoprotein export system ATPase subunit